MPINPWKILSESTVSVGWRKILRRLFLLPDGREVEFCVKKDLDPVCVLAFTEDGRIILVRQFRAGPNAVLDELPGGGIEKEETVKEAAARELLEETGYVGELTFIGTSLMCAYSTGLRYNFVAVNCRKVAEPKTDLDEFVEVVLVSLEDFRQHLRKGNLSDVTTGYLGLDYLKLL